MGGQVDPCFKPGTLVKSPSGDTLIEDLRVGDAVYAYDFKTGAVIESVVLGVQVNWTRHLVDIDLDGETISATRHHPFWVERSNGWLAAQDLGQGIELFSGSQGPVRIKSAEIHSRKSTTFNLEISGTHNYFVGQAGVLVHNGSDPQNPEQRQSDFADSTRRQSTIYIIRDRAGNVVYVGKTYQGEGDPRTRFGQHLQKKPHWRANGYYISEVIHSPPQGWTDFETAVWERHTIMKHGGLERLENIDDPISQEKFDRYRHPDFGHNPCR